MKWKNGELKIFWTNKNPLAEEIAFGKLNEETQPPQIGSKNKFQKSVLPGSSISILIPGKASTMNPSL